ncbi:unnamed protein product [Cercopithifilaria johnstoni]|uniref:Uncharacterized protein n=1 Tax=Cercopithifilaria johnstoni TaxID=2874296 RepID=A0A8J2Q573_9BILA|nr:unnamed protein product [Cercopithifilaria johnstoni]
MPKRLNDDLEEGEIFDDDEEFNNQQSNVTEYSSAVISEGTNLTIKCFQSLYHANSESLHSNNLEIPYQTAVFPEINGDNLKKDKSEIFDNYEENDKECFLDKRVVDEDQPDNELKVLNSEDELEYQSILSDESVDSDNDNNEFSDKIVCSGGIIAANEFHSRIAALTMDTEHITDRRNTKTNEDEMQTDLVEEVLVDDSWIFQSLGGDTEAVNVVEDEKQVHEGSNSQIKQIAELERKFAEEKENYVRNMYSLLVTARAQIAALKKENKKLEMKLQGNCTMNCPKCKHQICLRNNSLKPKYIKVLKGRCAIEMLFNNLEKMEEWLSANYLDINPDGLPVVLELPRKPTLTSTNSLLAPKTNSVRDIRRKSDKVTLTSSTHSVAKRQNTHSARTVNNFNKYSMKQCEKLSHVTRGEKTQDRSNINIAYSSCGKLEKWPRDRKRSGLDKCEEQQRHRILSVHISSDISFDRDQQRCFSSPTSGNFHKSCRNTKLNATKCMTSMPNRKGTDQEDQHPAIDSFRNRFEYRSPSVEYRRRPIRSPVCYKRIEENSYRNCRNRSRPEGIRSLE